MSGGISRRTLFAASGATLLLACIPKPVPGAKAHRLVRRGDRLFLPARINGTQVEALLDSAAETSIADAAFAQRIGLGGGKQTKARGTGAGTVEAELVPHVRIEAAGVDVRDATVAVLDLGDVARRLIGGRLDLIVGREIFDQSALLIDIAGGTIRPLAPGEAPKGTRLPLVSDRGNELMPVRIEGQDVQATFDLGNGSGVLVSKSFAEAHLLDGRPTGERKGGGIGGEHARKTLVLRSLELAGRRFENVEAAIDDTETAVAANVGVGLLSRFTITADYPNRAVWLDAIR